MRSETIRALHKMPTHTCAPTNYLIFRGRKLRLRGERPPICSKVQSCQSVGLNAELAARYPNYPVKPICIRIKIQGGPKIGPFLKAYNSRSQCDDTGKRSTSQNVHTLSGVRWCFEFYSQLNILFTRQANQNNCLLYTSPSPRDS